jgi:hypothetical protein
MEAIEKAILSRAQIPEMITNMAGELVNREEFAGLMESLVKRIEVVESQCKPLLGVSDATQVLKPAPQTAAAKKAAEKAAQKTAEVPAEGK